MNNNKKAILNAAISGLLLAGLTGSAFAVKTVEEQEATKKKETAAGKVKCVGRVVGGLNDCPTSQHACAGMGFQDDDPEEFIWLPRGTCERIVGMHILKPAKKEKDKISKKSEDKKKNKVNKKKES